MTPTARLLDRAARLLDAPPPTVPGQIAADDVEAEQQPAAQLPIFDVAGGTYWKAWRTT
jgi:hypothetical protein